MKITYNITISGQPIPLKRHRYVYKRGHLISYDPQKKQKEDFAWKCRAEISGNVKPIEGAFILSGEFYVSRKAMKKEDEGTYRIERPDIDNYLKFLLDSLQGSFFADDSHCVTIVGRKWHSKNARTELIIEELSTLRRKTFNG